MTVDLEDFRGWLHAVARRLLGPLHPDEDDLCQEGHIAMWRATKTHDPAKGSMTAWITRAAEQRMKDLAWGHGRPTGWQRREAVVRPAGAYVRGTRPRTGSASPPRPNDVAWDALPPGLQQALEPVTPDVADAAMWAYHHGQVLQALAQLTHHQREAALVALRGGQLTQAQRANLTSARRHLQRQLEHLSGCG